MEATGEKLTAEDSQTLAQDLWYAANKHKILAVAAVSSKDHHGFTVVTACVGGRLPNGRYAGPTTDYLVRSEEYANRDRPYWQSFIIDPGRHPKLSEQEAACA